MYPLACTRAACLAAHSLAAALRDRRSYVGRGLGVVSRNGSRLRGGRTAAGFEHRISVVRAATWGAAAVRHVVSVWLRVCSYPAPESEGENISAQHRRRCLLFHTVGG